LIDPDVRKLIDALLFGERQLAQAGFVLRPRRHAELLLEAATNLDRTGIYLNGREPLSDEARLRYENLLGRRLSGEPVQHIVGWTPFYGLRFKVSPGVFIPRFDSEILVQTAVNRTQQAGRAAPEILDLCCGCGAIGLATVFELPNARLTSLDSNLRALECCRLNVDSLALSERVSLVERDALSQFPIEWRGKFHIILANPPYIPSADLPSLHPDVRDGEPIEALTDGGDGLSFYRRWAETLPELLHAEGIFITEFGDGQEAAVSEIYRTAFKSIEIVTDLSGHPRGLLGEHSSIEGYQ
jgi:release factor glutamine methyltransferase